MAKKKNDELPEDGEIKPKKKGLFSFLRRKSKSKNDQLKTPEDTLVSGDEASGQTKPVRKKTTSTKKSAVKKNTADANKTAPKKRTRSKKQTEKPDIVEVEVAEDENSKKKKRSLFGFLRRKKKTLDNDSQLQVDEEKPSAPKKKAAKGKATDAVKTSVKKRGRPKKNVEETKIAASETAEDIASEPTKKKGLFGFLKRKKKSNSDEEQLESTVVTKEVAVDISVPPVGGEVLQMDVDPIVPENVVKKKFGFLTKKVILIILALCGVSGATGAAAIVFAGPLLGDDPSKGLACKVAHKADFVLMKEKRVTAFIRADLLPPRQRIEMLMSYTKFLETEYSDANLFTVSLIDTNGPMSRIKFRGDNIGAQVVYAPEPLMSMATDTKWEVRYVNVTEAFGGRFMGDRFTLSDDEINEFNNDLLLASDCYMDKTEEELAAEELAREEAEALAAVAGDEHEGTDEDAIDMEHAEPGFVDNILGMVGLGGDEHSEEEVDEGMDASDIMHSGDQLQLYPGDKRANADVIDEETGFFDDVLSFVGLGGGDEDAYAETIPGVLGTRVKYN